MKPLYCMDLFAGAGGIATGLAEAGFACLYANEVSPIYTRTLEHGHPDALVEADDIRAVDARSVRRALQLAKGDLSLLAGGPPCQGFSVNAPVRSRDDERNHLFKDYLRFVAEFEPQAILIENVPGILSFEQGRTVKEILRALAELGYACAVRILYAPHYGVPQMRWRTLILGNRLAIDPHLMFPLPTHHAKGRANFTSTLDAVSLVLSDADVRDHARHPFLNVEHAIGDLPLATSDDDADVRYRRPALDDFQSLMRRHSTGVSNHQSAGLGPANLERLRHIPPGGSWRDIPFDLLPTGMKRARRSDHTKRYGRLHPDGLASTILTKCDPHWGSYIHPTEDRVISVREAARLQTFPDHVKFFGSLVDQYKQVGNAVPPLLSRAIGKRIVDTLFSLDNVPELSPWNQRQFSIAL